MTRTQRTVVRVVVAVSVSIAAHSADAWYGAPGSTFLALAAKPLPDVLKNKRPPAPQLGLRIAELEVDAAREFGVANGVRVLHSTGAAYVSGLRGGDAIIDVNGQPIANPEAFWDALAAAGWRATLRVLRDGRTLSILLSGEPVRQ